MINDTNLPQQLNKVFQDLSLCKENKTCRKLTCRGYYFEPNSETISMWRKEGLYTKEIDRRAIFVCESPGPSQKLSRNSIMVARCWSESPRDKRFLEVRKKYELTNCYITNVVKCGVRNGNRHTEEEITNCSKFVKDEIQIIKPLIVVAVGEQAENILRKYYLAVLVAQGCHLFRITHYSARRNPWVYWDKEFPMLLDLLKAKAFQATRD